MYTANAILSNYCDQYALQGLNEKPHLMTRGRILVPVSFIDQSDAALTFARDMAALSNDMISCILILDEKAANHGQSGKMESKHKGRLEAELMLSQKVNSILKVKPQVGFEIMVSSGDFCEKVLEKASDLNVRFIVMGKPDRERKYAGIPRNCSREVILKAQVPVIFVSSLKSIQRMNIILSLDLIRPSRTQINCAIETALKLKARVVAIGVFGREFMELTPLLNRRLKDIEVLLDDANIPCETHLLMTNGSVPDEVISFSDADDSSVILLLTKHEMDHHSLSIRSEEKEIIARANAPVICFNPKSADAWSTENPSIINKTNPLAWFLLKDRFINY